MRIALDAETTSRHDHIWVVVTINEDTGEVKCHRDPSTLTPLIQEADQVIAHNGIGFDAWVLEKCWGVTIPLYKMTDTLVLSRLELPDRKGGHSLESWGDRFRDHKIDYPKEYRALHPEKTDPNDPWDDPDLPLLETYCKQDTHLVLKVCKHLERKLKEQGFSDFSIQIEYEVAQIIAAQERTGVLLDMEATQRLYATLLEEYTTLYRRLEQAFEPTKVVMKTKIKYIPFNPGSRQQIIERLTSRGWKPTAFTEKGQPSLDDETLAAIDMPEAQDFARMFMLSKRISQIKQWIKFCGQDGRVHGSISSCGAITGRMTHFSPNLGQVPAKDVPYGAECRSLFVTSPGYKLVGIDASGLELRMLAHYMNDPEYIAEVLDGDVHTKNQLAAGLETRPQAKTFIYAFLYGAGEEKIGSIVKGGAKEGAQLIERFLSATPALQALRQKIKRIAAKGSVPGIDGRRIHIRHIHAALNTLLQGAGAIVMKLALIIFNRAIIKRGLDARFVLNVHDEWQLEVREDQAEEVGKLGVWSIEQAGKDLGMRIPLTGEFHVGNNWAETH